MSMSVPMLIFHDVVAVKILGYISRMHGDQLIQKFYPISEKFWLHRSNSIEKLEELSSKYEGVELDIVFFAVENNFDVSHDSNGRIDYPLDSFLHVLANTDNRVWLDFKNLNMNNSVQSLYLLSKMLERNNINKDRVIVESRDYNALKLFKEQGFYTSFYCPVDDKYLNTKEGRGLFVELVSKAIDSGSVDAVSFPVEYYSLVKSINHNTDLLTWNHSAKWFNFYFDPKLLAIFNDQHVKVILVKDSAKINR